MPKPPSAGLPGDRDDRCAGRWTSGFRTRPSATAVADLRERRPCPRIQRACERFRPLSMRCGCLLEVSHSRQKRFSPLIGPIERVRGNHPARIPASVTCIRARVVESGRHSQLKTGRRAACGFESRLGHYGEYASQARDSTEFTEYPALLTGAFIFINVDLFARVGPERVKLAQEDPDAVPVTHRDRVPAQRVRRCPDRPIPNHESGSSRC